MQPKTKQSSTMVITPLFALNRKTKVGLVSGYFYDQSDMGVMHKIRN